MGYVNLISTPDPLPALNTKNTNDSGGKMGFPQGKPGCILLKEKKIKETLTIAISKYFAEYTLKFLTARCVHGIDFLLLVLY